MHVVRHDFEGQHLRVYISCHPADDLQNLHAQRLRQFQMARDWAFQRLVRDYERLPQTVAGLPFLAFACLMLNHAVLALGTGP